MSHSIGQRPGKAPGERPRRIRRERRTMKPRLRLIPAPLLVAAFSMALCPLVWADDGPRLNQIQVIGSHNSYHIEPFPAVRALIAATGEEHAQGLEYTHPPLAEQFSSRGIRQIELDLFHDPEGGRYAEPAAQEDRPRARARSRSRPRPRGTAPPARHQGAARPGHRLSLHRGHPGRRPEAGSNMVQGPPTACADHDPARAQERPRERACRPGPLPFDRKALEGLEGEIPLGLSTPTRSLPPDEVRRSSDEPPRGHPEAGLALLDAVRGRVLFVLDNEDKVRDLYLQGHTAPRVGSCSASVPRRPSRGRLVQDQRPDRRFRPHPPARRRRLPRPHAGRREHSPGRRATTTMRDKALSSGAQFISTDYPVPDPRFTSYCVQLPGPQPLPARTP